MNMTKKEINQLKDLLFKLEQDTRLKDVLNACEELGISNEGFSPVVCIVKCLD